MLQNKRELEKFLEKKCEAIVFNKELSEEIRNYILSKYNYSTGNTMDMIAQRVSLTDKTEFELFCLLDGIDVAANENNKKDFYTELEISTYLNQKIGTKGIKFPIRIKCEQVATDQWIGAIESKFFMDLRREQLIRYNANAQRVMKRIIKGENILFKLVPNKVAIAAIRHLMQNHNYIPTPITLNIPYNSEANFYYDTKERELVIKNIETFDISDGYHRYLAMCEEHDNNPEFNCPMEIRIINFTDEKTRQFIYQEDQKTKMAKIDSDTMNTNRPSNITIDRLNEMPGFDLKGQIGRNIGTVSYTGLSEVIEFFYFKEKKAYTNVNIIQAANDIKIKLNSLTGYNMDYLTKPLSMKELALIFYVFNIEQDVERACIIIDKALKNNVVNNIKQSRMGKPMLNAISQLI